MAKTKNQSCWFPAYLTWAKLPTLTSNSNTSSNASMLKLGRAQGVAIAAALQRDIPIFEYAPRKVKMSVTGSGTASKEQIAALLPKFMTIHTTSQLLDETDAIAIAYCHFLQSNSPLAQEGHSCKSWSEYIKKNPDKLI